MGAEAFPGGVRTGVQVTTDATCEGRGQKMRFGGRAVGDGRGGTEGRGVSLAAGGENDLDEGGGRRSHRARPASHTLGPFHTVVPTARAAVSAARHTAPATFVRIAEAESCPTLPCCNAALPAPDVLPKNYHAVALRLVCHRPELVGTDHKPLRFLVHWLVSWMVFNLLLRLWLFCFRWIFSRRRFFFLGIALLLLLFMILFVVRFLFVVFFFFFFKVIRRDVMQVVLARS